MNKKALAFINDSINVISMSGGKDSTATLLLAIRWCVKEIYAVFADTGHEHSETYAFIKYLEKVTGVKIHIVRADFEKQIEKKRKSLIQHLIELSSGGPVSNKRLKGYTAPMLERIIDNLVPTGIPFLDLCIWKGRFPSSKATFCTEELKHYPLDMWMLKKSKEGRIISWQGVRKDESRKRANLSKWDYGDYGAYIFRPIINWKWERVFEEHKFHGVMPNHLYKQGMKRVGCMPCVQANKGELCEIGKRFNDEIERVAQWEEKVSLASKNGSSTFFYASTDPTIATKNNNDISVDTHGIRNIMEWAKTGRGGRQFDLIASTQEPSMCQSAYGLCE